MSGFSDTRCFTRSKMKRRFLIYALHHPDSQHVYVGKSCSGLTRPLQHGTDAYMKRNSRYPVVLWIKKYRSLGKEYHISILEERETAEELVEAEKFYIGMFRWLGIKLLNCTDGGDGQAGALARRSEAMKGRIFSPEHLEKLREARRKRSPEDDVKQREATAVANRRRVWTEESRAKVAEAGRKIPEERRQQLSLAAKERWAVPEMREKMTVRGWSMPESAKKKISEAQRGRECSPETRAKMSHNARNRSFEHREKLAASSRGRGISDETRKRMSLAQQGRVTSQETRAKLSAALRGRMTPEHKEKIIFARRRRAVPAIRINLLNNRRK